MKNIHVIKTDKASRLHKYDFDGFALSKEALNWKEAKNIYITSDEEIKDGDWFMDITFNNYGEVYKSAGVSKSLGYENWIKSTTNIIKEPITQCKKIILTDNKDLIKDGVQAINDEFIEWFVKNPSCEFVEVTEYLDSGFSYGYKIIIPKEEPKQDLPIVNGSYGCTIQTKKQEPKQETLEELKKWREEALIAHEINQKVIKKLMDEKSEQIDSEKKIDKILQKLEEIKIMINRIN